MTASAEDPRRPVDDGSESVNTIRRDGVGAYGGRVRFGLLGPTVVTDDGRGPVAMGGAVQRRVLTALLVGSGRTVPVDRLVLAVWGDDAPPTAERSLQSHVTRLRDLLGRDGDGARLTFVGGGYRLDVDEDALDTSRFVHEVHGARDTGRSDPARAARQVEAALALWRGQPYADLVDTEYPAADAASLEEERMAAQVDHAAYLLDAGQVALAVPELEALVTEHRFLERGWELLVVALYRQGRQADALAAYGRARTALDDELGVEPGPQLRALEQQVLAQDPALLGPVPTGPVARARCPYKGLSRYDVTDAGLFVGRERLVEELVATLVDRRLLVLVGPSGAGKSSLLRAGLLPRLEEGAVSGSESWTVRVVIPHDDPVSHLRAALADHPDMLVLDQGESAWGDQVSRADRDSVAALLADPGLARSGEPTRVVIALRADFYGRLTEHPTLARVAGPATVLLGPPSADDLRRIVTEPARLVGLSVETSVVEEIVAQTVGMPVCCRCCRPRWCGCGSTARATGSPSPATAGRVGSRRRSSAPARTRGPRSPTTSSARRPGASSCGWLARRTAAGSPVGSRAPRSHPSTTRRRRSRPTCCATGDSSSRTRSRSRSRTRRSSRAGPGWLRGSPMQPAVGTSSTGSRPRQATGRTRVARTPSCCEVPASWPPPSWSRRTPRTWPRWSASTSRRRRRPRTGRPRPNVRRPTRWCAAAGAPACSPRRSRSRCS